MKPDRKNFHPQVGEVVRIRDWDDMAAEFGTTSCGDIRVPFGFYPAMRKLCGIEFIITRISDGSLCGHGTGYSISKDMVEYPPDDSIDCDFSEVNDYIGAFKIV